MQALAKHLKNGCRIKGGGMNTKREVVVGIFVLIGLLCTAYLTVKLGRMEVFGSDAYELQARFTSASGLRVGASVEVAGVEVGKVSLIDLDAEHSQALVTLLLNNKLKFTDDTIASIKTSGLIGDKYINLSPGGSGIFLEAGEEITDTESAVDIESLISKYAFGGV